MTIDLTRLTNLCEQIQSRVQQTKTHADGRSWYRITNRAPETAEIFIYDAIGEWGVTARDFVAELRGTKAQRIDLHINSGGGQVFDGVAIYNALVNHPARVTVYVDALAASAASFIAMAGDEVIVEKTSRLMIHDAAGLCIGNADDMREMADLLDSLSDTIAEVYADRAGGPVEKWRKAMRSETWYTADEAVSAGLADRVAGKEPDSGEPAANVAVSPVNGPAPAEPETPDAEADRESPFNVDLDEFQRLMKEAFSS